MSSLRGKKLDPHGDRKGVQTGKTANCGKQSDKWATPAKAATPKSASKTK